MPSYRIYRRGADGHIDGPAEQIECDDDVTAVKLARERLMDTAWKSGTANGSWP
jgi:hypothetical protein